MTNNGGIIGVACLLLMVCGCSDSLDPKSLVKRARIVAAQPAVVGEPSRATPAPGEQVEVTFVVAEPGPALQKEWNFVACVPESNVLNLPLCKETVLVACDGCVSGAPTTDGPTVTLTVPDTAELEDETNLLVVGALCVGGSAASLGDIVQVTTGEADSVSPCTDSTNEGEFLATEIPLALAQRNDNPSIVETEINSGDWTGAAPADAPVEGCGGQGFVTRSAGAPPFSLSLEVSSDSFEMFDVEAQDMTTTTETESLLVSWHGTGGEFDRSFAFLEPDEGTVASVAWAPPASAPPTGTLVRFTFVVRDRDELERSRGGVAVVERALCICPTPGGCQ